jgi:hypothetical protein
MAALLDCHPSSVRRRAAAGRLKGFKLGGCWYLLKPGSGEIPEEPPYVSTSELYQRGVRVRAVKRMLKHNEIPGAFKGEFKPWAIPRAALEKALAR